MVKVSSCAATYSGVIKGVYTAFKLQAARERPRYRRRAAEERAWASCRRQNSSDLRSPTTPPCARLPSKKNRVSQAHRTELKTAQEHRNLEVCRWHGLFCGNGSARRRARFVSKESLITSGSCCMLPAYQYQFLAMNFQATHSQSECVFDVFEKHWQTQYRSTSPEPTLARVNSKRNRGSHGSPTDELTAP